MLSLSESVLAASAGTGRPGQVRLPSQALYQRRLVRGAFLREQKNGVSDNLARPFQHQPPRSRVGRLLRQQPGHGCCVSGAMRSRGPRFRSPPLLGRDAGRLRVWGARCPEGHPSGPVSQLCGRLQDLLIGATPIKRRCGMRRGIDRGCGRTRTPSRGRMFLSAGA